MSVKIRLAKTGKTHQISYRVVAQDTRAKRDGKFLEILGSFNPQDKKGTGTKIKQDRVKFWVENGAKPTPAVGNLLNPKSA